MHIIAMIHQILLSIRLRRGVGRDFVHIHLLVHPRPDYSMRSICLAHID